MVRRVWGWGRGAFLILQYCMLKYMMYSIVCVFRSGLKFRRESEEILFIWLFFFWWRHNRVIRFWPQLNKTPRYTTPKRVLPYIHIYGYEYQIRSSATAFATETVHPNKNNVPNFDTFDIITVLSIWIFKMSYDTHHVLLIKHTHYCKKVL